MKRRVALRLAALLPACAAATVFAQPASPPAPRPSWPAEDSGYFYACAAAHRDAHGTLTMGANVNSNDVSYHGEWTSAQSAAGLTLSYHLWDNSVRLSDQTSIGVTVQARWRGNPRVMILLSRSGYYNGVGLAFRSDWQRAMRRQVATILPFGDLRAYAGGAPLIVLVRDRQGRDLVQDRIDPAVLEATAVAADALRLELDAMIVDFRHRCTRQEESNEITI